MIDSRRLGLDPSTAMHPDGIAALIQAGVIDAFELWSHIESEVATGTKTGETGIIIQTLECLPSVHTQISVTTLVYRIALFFTA